MNLRDLVTVRVPPTAPPNVGLEAAGAEGAAAPAAASANETKVSVFVTPQSIVTFPVASSVVVVTWKVLGAVVPDLANALWVPAILSLIVGLFIYYLSLNDQMSSKEKNIGLFIALVNSVFLLASALGIDQAGQTVTGGGTPDGPSPTPTVTP